MSSKKKILIVDDERKICTILGNHLKKLYGVEVAYDGQQALQKVEEFQPDCILLDYKLPVMDGPEVIKRVKSKYPNIEIIMISANGDIGNFSRCFLEGASDFVVKPIDLSNLEDRVLYAVKKHHKPTE
jgi:CheY-like chemotaxis protein